MLILTSLAHFWFQAMEAWQRACTCWPEKSDVSETLVMSRLVLIGCANWTADQIRECLTSKKQWNFFCGPGLKESVIDQYNCQQKSITWCTKETEVFGWVLKGKKIQQHIENAVARVNWAFLLSCISCLRNFLFVSMEWSFLKLLRKTNICSITSGI